MGNSHAEWGWNIEEGDAAGWARSRRRIEQSDAWVHI